MLEKDSLSVTQPEKGRRADYGEDACMVYGYRRWMGLQINVAAGQAQGRCQWREADHRVADPSLKDDT